MRLLIIITLLFSSAFASDTYVNSKLRAPISSYTQGIGGISAISNGYSTINNPSLIPKKKRVSLSFSKLDNDLQEATANFSSTIKNKLGFNATYLYRGILNTAVYTNDEVHTSYNNDVSHYFNLGLNYTLYNGRKRGKLSLGAALNLSKEYITPKVSTDNPINGMVLGINFIKKELEIGASLQNILGTKEWASTEITGGETQKEILSYDIPLKGLIAAKYTLAHRYSVMAQADLEDTEDEVYKAIYRGAFLVNLYPVELSLGYGDERYSFGFGYKRAISKTALGIHTALSYSKESNFNASISSSFEF